MSDEQKYLELLKELGQLLNDKNTTIALKDYRIEDLEEKLAAAEKEIEELKGAKTHGKAL